MSSFSPHPIAALVEDLEQHAWVYAPTATVDAAWCRTHCPPPTAQEWHLNGVLRAGGNSHVEVITNAAERFASVFTAAQRLRWEVNESRLELVARLVHTNLGKPPRLVWEPEFHLVLIEPS